MKNLKNIKIEKFDSNFTFWNFENLRDSKNYKSWNRKCKNALQTMNVWHVCVWSNSNKSKIFIEMNDKFIENSIFVEWKINIKFYNNHSRIAKKYIYNKFDSIFVNLIDDLNSIFDVWNVLQQQYFDVDFTTRHTTYQKFVIIILTFCNNDFSNFIVIFRFLQRNFRDMSYSVKKWTIVFNFLSNLNDHFKKYVFRIITNTNLSFFEKITINFQKLNRINKKND